MDFQQQVNDMKDALTKVFDYPFYSEYLNAKVKLLNGDWSDEVLAEIVGKASHSGAILRKVYRNYVINLGYDLKAYWDAVIIIFMHFNVWVLSIEEHKKDKDLQRLIELTSLPKWTEYGLYGGPWTKLKKDLENLYGKGA
ncbi:hypothetical protein [Bacillus cereus]|uniref:hypothetical protein n=1 Tax=Bacillus cereus TaxID=1396 RepID=UPI0025B27455|nr:hypothetical protein [Bacillus cereus]WJX07517.1 hypothetical protein QTA68_11770 [Bacillus cereus]